MAAAAGALVEAAAAAEWVVWVQTPLRLLAPLQILCMPGTPDQSVGRAVKVLVTQTLGLQPAELVFTGFAAEVAEATTVPLILQGLRPGAEVRTLRLQQILAVAGVVGRRVLPRPAPVALALSVSGGLNKG